MNAKQQVLEAIQRLPDDASLRDVHEELKLLEALQESEEDLQAGNVVAHEEVAARLESWISG